MSLKRAASSGIKWSAVANVGRRLISLGTNIVLARLLAPQDFGLVAMAALVMSFLELFRDLGTGSAIVQRSEIDDTLLSSIFWVNAAFGSLVAGLVVFSAPVVGWFYHEPRVVPLLQVMAAGFFMSALGIVQNGLMTREMRFNQLARLELFTALAAASSGITLALLGWGVWALVAQMMISSILGTVLLWLVRRWRPRFVLSSERLGHVMGYSLNLTAANLLNFAQRNADNLLIGRYLGAEALGYYDLAYRLMLYPLQSISAVISRVMFPLLSRLQEDSRQFRFIYLQMNAAIALIAFPVMFGFFALREPIIHFLVGIKWDPVITLLAFFAPLGAIQAVMTTVGTIYLAKGRTRLMLGWTAAASLAIVLAFVVGLQWGIVGVAAAYAVVSVLLMYPGFVIPFRLINLTFMDLVHTLRQPLMAALLMASIVLMFDGEVMKGYESSIRLAIGVPLGAVIYSTMIMLLFKDKALYIFRTLLGR